MKIVIDTNRYVDADRGDARAIEVFRAAEKIYIPFIVAAELRYGFLYGSKANENERRLVRFLSTPRVKLLLADEETSHHYARLALQLRKKGTPIPTNDIWIASLVVQYGLALFARDKHFDQLTQLRRIV